MVLATVLTVADNGLAFTAVAERAGPSGPGAPSASRTPHSSSPPRLVPPLAGLLIATEGYAAAFGVAAAFPVLAAALVPVGDERGPS